MMNEIDKDSRPECAKCPLRDRPFVGGWGDEGGGVMCIGEAPGEDEAKHGRPFIGKSGQFLSELIKSMGFSRANTYDTNVVKCHPPGNRKPTKKMIDCCRSILVQEIKDQKPEIIITLGGIAFHQFLPYSISGYHGTRIETAEGFTLIPMFHPAYALHKPAQKKVIEDDFKQTMKKPPLGHISGEYTLGTDSLILSTSRQAIDTETEGLDRDSPLIGAGFGNEGYTAYLEADDALAYLQYNPPDVAIMHNAKFDLQVFARNGIPLDQWKQIDDPMVLAYCMNRSNLGLKDLAVQELNLMMPRYEDVCPAKGTLRDVPVEDVAQYCGSDCDGTWRLFDALWDKATPRERNLYEKVDRPATLPITAMEMEGMRLDLDFLGQERERILQEMGEITNETESRWGLNDTIMRSPKQLGNFIHDELGIKLKKRTKATGQFQTDAGVLYPLADQHPAISIILKWKELEKLRGTYIEGIIKRQVDGILHTTFNQCRTASGRLSSSNPNLQVLPHAGGLRTMILAKEGNSLLSFDLSQIELHIVAHVSQDKRMLEMFAAGDVDIHDATSDLIFGDHEYEHRWIAKQANYAITYGGSYQALLGGRFIRFSANVITQELAEFVFNRYFELFPGVGQWLEITKANINKYGYVDTLYGRRRYFPKTNNPTIIRDNEREGINHIPQGTCADIVRMQMAAVLPIWTPMLQVHDELVFDVPDGKVEELIPRLRHAMINIDVPFSIKVDCAVGKNFGELREYNA